MSASARFTPSLLDRKTLEGLFVNRDEQLSAAIDHIHGAAASGRLAHLLYVGPRGAGKTHLIAMVYHRAKDMEEFGERFALSWLPEDPWGIFSFESLMGAIRSHSEPSVEVEADAARPKVTVVLSENFDRVLSSLGPEGQRQLRAHIEREGDLLLITTATRLTDHMMQQAKPFYGFFNTVELKPFALDEAISMLRRIAEIDGDKTLAARLDEPDTRARLAAIEQLAGGLPRIWAIFASGLTVDRLRDMTDLLIERFDDLTPYYQEQFSRLSPNELKAVLALINADGALCVQDIARATGIDQRSLSTTLRQLRPNWVIPREGYLMQFVDKRLTYYQLAEPLARVAVQIKASKGKPVRMVLNFLTAWFSRDELQRGMPTQYPALELVQLPKIMDEPDCSPRLSMEENGKEWQYAYAAMAAVSRPENIVREVLIDGWPSIQGGRFPIKRDPDVVRECARIDAALSKFQHEKSTEFLLALPPAICNLAEQRLEQSSVGFLRVELALIAVLSGGDERIDGDGERVDDGWLLRAIDASAAIDPAEEKIIQLSIASLRLLLGQTAAGLEAFGFAFALGEKELTGQEWRVIETALNCTTHPIVRETKLKLIDAAKEYASQTDIFHITRVYIEVFDSRGDYPKALELRGKALPLCEKALGKEHPDIVTVYSDIAFIYSRQGDYPEALEWYGKALAILEKALGKEHPNTAATYNNIAAVYESLGDYPKALEWYSRAYAVFLSKLGEKHPDSVAVKENMERAQRKSNS